MSQKDKSDSEQRLAESTCVPQESSGGVFQRVRLTSMSAIKKANGLLEDRLRRKVMRNADLSHIMRHTGKSTASAGVASQPAATPATIATMYQAVSANESAVEADIRRRAEDRSLFEFCDNFGLNLRIPRSELVLGNMWGIKLAQWMLLLSERELSVVEAQFRMEVLLSVGAIVFAADKATGKYIQDHDFKAGMLQCGANSVRALSHRRLMLAKGLPLDELRRKALEEVYLKCEREALTKRKEHSEHSSPLSLGGEGKYEEGENTGKRERKLTLVVDTEAANKEEQSKMKYKMQRLDKLKFRADALIQAGLGELAVGLL
jgi:hypothetical protein